MDFDAEIKHMGEHEVAEIAESLSSQGINAIVVGHSIMESGPRMAENFARYGIRLIASDVGMSSAYNESPGTGGVKIGVDGSITSHNNAQGLSSLYQGKRQRFEEAILEAA